MKYKIIRNLPDFVFELERLRCVLHEVDMRDIKQKVYLSKLEKRATYSFIALEQPDFDKIKEQFHVKEIYFILHPKMLVVYDPNSSRYIDQFFVEVEQNQYKNASPSLLLLGMLEFFSAQLYRAIPKFNHEVIDLQEKVMDEHDDSDLITKIQRIKRNLVTFNSVLDPIVDLNKDLITLKHFAKNGIYAETLNDYADRINKVIKTINNFEKQMDILSSSNESQIARKTNRNLGTLTIINAMLLLPPIVVSIWHYVKYTDSDYVDYLGISAAFVVLLVLLFIYLKRTKII